MGLLGTTLIGASLFSRLFFGDTATAQSECVNNTGCPETVQYTIQRLPSPTPTATRSTPTVEPSPLPLLGSEPTAPDAVEPKPEAPVAATESLESAAAITETTTVIGSVVSSVTSDTVALTTTNGISGSDVASQSVTATVVVDSDAIASAYVESYTSTNRAAPPPAGPPTPTPEPEPIPAPACTTSSTAHFDLIPIEGAATRDHPDAVHGDLNLALRGFVPTGEALERVTYNGNTDSNAPRLHGLFEPNRQAQITRVLKVNDWNWNPSSAGGAGQPRG